MDGMQEVDMNWFDKFILQTLKNLEHGNLKKKTSCSSSLYFFLFIVELDLYSKIPGVPNILQENFRDIGNSCNIQNHLPRSGNGETILLYISEGTPERYTRTR